MFNNDNKDTCNDLESSNSGLEHCVTAKQEMRATDLRRRRIKDKPPSSFPMTCISRWYAGTLAADVYRLGAERRNEAELWPFGRRAFGYVPRVQKELISSQDLSYQHARHSHVNEDLTPCWLWAEEVVRGI